VIQEEVLDAHELILSFEGGELRKVDEAKLVTFTGVFAPQTRTDRSAAHPRQRTDTMADAFTTIQTNTADGVLTITLNRPERYNAFNDAMSIELGAALRAAQRDEAVRCLVLTGAGKAFCSGQDLQEVQQFYEPSAGAAGQSPAAAAAHTGPAGTPAKQAGGGTGEARGLDFGARLRQKYNPIITRLRTIEKPVVAAVNGVAAGAGASFAFACDLRICARSARFVMSFVNVGLAPDSGATLTLLQHVGYARAAELCFLGERLSAEEALRWNLVNRVVDDEQLAADAQELAARLAALPTRAIGLTKRALNHAWAAELEDQLEWEAFLQQAAGQTADHREGVAAFLEKRKPKFLGR
jgi:2-(1,2-epoxy-1,2-dihydrophenyl)acetyl-CoA isomerase